MIGGRDAPKARYPYIVSFQKNIGNEIKHYCAGSILNSQWIISVAHCFPNNLTIDKFVIKAGKYNIKIVESTEQTVQAEQIFIHEKYPKER